MIPGIVVGAPASGSGKTTVTLALLRHLRERGLRVGSLKVGPDYIDPAFHAAASGRACLNVDPWAMRESTFADAVGAASEDADLVVVEGVMGLFDGATADEGSTADVAAASGGRSCWWSTRARWPPPPPPWSTASRATGQT